MRQCRDKVSERLACSGSGFSDQDRSILDRKHHGLRHLELLFAQAKAGNGAGKDSVFAEDILERERHALSTVQPARSGKGGANVIGKPGMA